MRSTAFVVALVVWAGLGLASVGAAQTVSGPTIHNVTLREDTGVLTITGIGFGRELLVTVDGQPVTVMSGGTDTQIDVFAPAVLSTPGTYRLTVVDPVRQMGDAFVVASHAGLAPAVGLMTSGRAAAPNGGGVPLGSPVARSAAASTSSVSIGGPVTASIEDSGSPYRTALGYHALFSNTMSAQQNTAIGYQALGTNTTGQSNTATGFVALASNTTGVSNTAIGSAALLENTSGALNTALGENALYENSTGSYNTASGHQALLNNTTGWYNTAHGFYSGLYATTGSYNIFLGAQVWGTAADTNTIRIGLPYNANDVSGQNQTFIAGIRGTAVSGGLPVVVDAAGKMGTAGGSAPLSLLDASNTWPSQLRLGFLNGVADYGIGRNPSDGVLDFTGSQFTYSGFRFNTPNAGTALAIANNGTVSMMDATNSRPYQLRLGFLNGLADYGIGRSPFDGYLNFAATQGTYSGYRFNTPNAGTAVTIANNGAVGVGVTAPTQPLQLASGAYVSAGGVWTNASSRTLKDHIASLSTADAIQAVADLSPVTFVYKAAPGEAHVGFIAEDVPALVATQDRRSLATMDLLAVVTKVVQVQQQQLHEQEAINADLRTRLATLEALLARER